MPSFDVTKQSDVDCDSFRVAKIRSLFDLDTKQIQEHFKGTIEYPDDWRIGVIVGPSGSGKSTIINELYKDYITSYSSSDYTHSSVIDDMPKKCSVDEITKMFATFGFSSVPSWLKPYSVLSNGEKARVDLARAMLSHDDLVVYDEFTSVIDRTVAQTLCIACNKAMKHTDKKLIAVTCHYDVLDYIEPDWVFDTQTMSMVAPKKRDIKNSKSSHATNPFGNISNVITI